MKSSRRISSYIVTAIVVAVIGGVLGLPSSVHALGTWFYDTADWGASDGSPLSAGSDMVLWAGGDPYVNNAVTNVRAYFSGPSGSVEIWGMDYCLGTWDRHNSGSPVVANGTIMTDFTFKVNGATQTKYGYKIAVGCAAPAGATFSSANLFYDTGAQLYYIDISVAGHAGTFGYQNGFKVRATGPNAVMVAHKGGISGHDVTLNPTKTEPEYINYVAKFGADCSVTGPTTKSISLYDMDNIDDASGAQVGREITVRLRKQLDGTATWLDVPLSHNSTMSPSMTVLPPASASSVATNVYFKAEPGYRYEFTIYDSYWNNTVQYSTPFDGIFYKTPCGGDWEIDGSTSMSGAFYVVPGDMVKWTHTLTKDGDGTAPAIGYTIQRAKSPNDGAIPAGAYSNVSSGSWTPGASISYPSTYVPTGADIGQRVCERIRWVPTASDNGAASTSTEMCVKVGLIPSAQVWGNDVRTGSAYSVADNKSSIARGYLVRYNTEYSGSWAEYGVLATGTVSNLASGAGLVLSPTDNPSNWSKLTFANAGAPAAYGKFAAPASAGVKPNIAKYLTGTSLSGVTIENKGAGVVHIKDGSDGNAFENKVIYATGDVRIEDNVINDENTTLAGAEQIKQMVIIANNIYIKKNVSRVDAWLIAVPANTVPAGGDNGVVDTCFDSPYPSQLTIAECGVKLTVTGAIQASHLRLRRTNGDKTSPAEILNLRSDAYLWARGVAQQNGRWETTYTEELPPRY